MQNVYVCFGRGIITRQPDMSQFSGAMGSTAALPQNPPMVGMNQGTMSPMGMMPNNMGSMGMNQTNMGGVERSSLFCVSYVMA